MIETCLVYPKTEGNATTANQRVRLSFLPSSVMIAGVKYPVFDYKSHSPAPRVSYTKNARDANRFAARLIGYCLNITFCTFFVN